MQVKKIAKFNLLIQKKKKKIGIFPEFGNQALYLSNNLAIIT